MLHNVVLPLVSLLSGLISLYIDPKEDRAKAWMIVAVLLISAVFTGVSGSLDDHAAEKNATEAKDQIGQLTEISLNQSRQLGKVQSVVGSVQTGVLALLRERGLSSEAIERITPEQIQQSDLADTARTQVLPAQLASATAKGLVVQYYPKDFDGEVVRQALSAGGFKFKAGKSKNSLATNAMWVGDSVSVDNIKFVALTLIRAGVQLRSIRRFKDGGGEKSNLIEVGADPATTEEPVVTVERIQGLTQLPPRDVT
jgi:hypothetical protein